LVLNSGEKQSYGYGWQLAKIEKRKVIAHGGGIDGFLSYALYVPDSKLFVTVLCNTMGQSPEQIAFRIAKIALNVEDKEPSTLALEESKLDEYVGVYKISDRESRILSREGVQLYSQRNNNAKIAVYPYAADAFYFKDSFYRLKFFRNSSGEVTHYEGEGNEYVNQIGRRTSKEMPKDRQPIALDRAVFDKYIGQYEIAPKFILTVKLDGDKFMTQASGQQAFEIFPESEIKFFTKAFDAQLEFIKDEKGEVTSVILYQAGRKTPAKKITSEIPKERIAISLDAKVLERYVGEYELAPRTIVTVRRDNDKLTAQLTGQPVAELFAEAEAKFFYKIVDAQIEFLSGDAGTVTGLKLYQGGNIVPGKKIK
jgi:D-alanyl-D-alanine carboxypeptidase